MTYASGFQSNAFQSSAFQIKTDNNGLLGGGPGKKHTGGEYSAGAYQRNRIIALRAELKQINDEIANAEERKLEQLALLQEKRLARKAAKELAALEALLLAEINKLRMERAWLIRRIDDEECFLVLLMRKKKRII